MPTQRKMNLCGGRIRRARRAQTWSQQQLAACVSGHGVVLDQGAISRIESGGRNVSDYELVALARCLSVSISYLCFGANPARA